MRGGRLASGFWLFPGAVGESKERLRLFAETALLRDCGCLSFFDQTLQKEERLVQQNLKINQNSMNTMKSLEAFY